MVVGYNGMVVVHFHFTVYITDIHINCVCIFTHAVYTEDEYTSKQQ